MASWDHQLLSRIIQTGDVSTALEWGVTPRDFTSSETRALFEQLLAYSQLPQMRGAVWGPEALRSKFPHFQLVSDPSMTLEALCVETRNHRISTELRSMLQQVEAKVDFSPMDALGALHSAAGGLIDECTTKKTDIDLGDAFAEANRRRELRESGVDTSVAPYPWEPLQREFMGVQEDDYIVVYGRPKNMKAQPLDEPVLTPSGFVPIGSLRLGDLVIGSNGEPTRVTGIFPQGVCEVFNVVMSDGSSTRCCDQHLWYTTTHKEQRRGAHGSVRTLQEIRATLKYSDGGDNHQIPLVRPVQYAPSEPLPLLPYIVGARIGDESLGRGSEERFIPPRYLRASVEERLELLRGLGDTAGTVDGAQLVISTSSPQLAEDITTLARSLGAIVNNNGGHDTEGLQSYFLYIRFVDGTVPVSSTKHPTRWSSRPEDGRRTIRSAEPAGNVECVCIAVEAADQLYVTKDFIVTHNTWVISYLMAWFIDIRKKVLIYTKEMTPINVAQRIGCCIAAVDYNNFRKGTMSDAERLRVNLAERLLKAMIRDSRNIILSGQDTPKNGDRVSWLETKVKKYEPDIVFVDGMYLMTPSNGAKKTNERVESISRDMRQMILNTKRPAICTLQANRQAAKNQEANLDEVAFSDAVGQDATALIRCINEKGQHDPTRRNTILLAMGSAGREANLDGWRIYGEPASNFSLYGDGKLESGEALRAQLADDEEAGAKSGVVKKRRSKKQQQQESDDAVNSALAAARSLQ